jgi:hypothetical protein
LDPAKDEFNMPIALTVFGVAGQGTAPTLCYVLLRSVRGRGEYPDPTRPRGPNTDGVRRVALSQTAIELVTFDTLIATADEAALLQDLERGRFTVPTESPIASGALITAQHFGPIIVEEQMERSGVSGNGLLRREGLVSDAPLQALQSTLSTNSTAGTEPAILGAIMDQIATRSGLQEYTRHSRPLGLVDYFYRSPAVGPVDGPLFDIVPDKPDIRTRLPLLRVFLRRYAAPLDQSFKLAITLGNYDHVVKSQLMDIECGAREVVVTAETHITDVALQVFDDAGRLVDRLNGKFAQSIDFGLSVLGAVDELPGLLPGGHGAPDLQTRPRLHTVAFQGPARANRSGGLDMLRALDQSVTAQLGPALPGARENVWFEQGATGQLDVIRWIKKKVEKPGMRTAYFIDPYLGSESLQRVIARQGHETAELVILVSPGRIDPDAETEGSGAGSDFIAKLAATANAWADKLAGKILIAHVKKGDGSRQAFHDRYLCTIDQNGIPTAYLLSNSLSKAAGDWPFAICELDRILSWRIYRYILAMMGDSDKTSPVRAELIWKSGDSQTATAVTAPVASSASGSPWAEAANDFLTDIWTVIVRNGAFKPQVAARMQTFLRHWPEGVDLEAFGKALFDIVSHRDAIVVFVSDQLRLGDRGALADILDDRLLDRFLDTLPTESEKGGWFVPFDARRVVLANLAQTIARKDNATNVVRGRFNPKVDTLVALIETQRFAPDLTWAAFEAAQFLSIVALLVSIHAKAPESHRVGLASDYIHWVGRLVRSAIATNAYTAYEVIPPEWRDDMHFVADAMAAARRALGAALDEPLGRVMSDPCIVAVFKAALQAALANV